MCWHAECRRKTLSKHWKHVPAHFSSLRGCNCRQTPFESNHESNEKKDTQLEWRGLQRSTGAQVFNRTSLTFWDNYYHLAVWANGLGFKLQSDRFECFRSCWFPVVTKKPQEQTRTTSYRSILLLWHSDGQCRLWDGRVKLLCFGLSRVSSRRTFLFFFFFGQIEYADRVTTSSSVPSVVEGHVVTERMKQHHFTFNLSYLPSLYIRFPLEWLCDKSTLPITRGYFEFLITLENASQTAWGSHLTFKKTYSQGDISLP